MRPDRAVEPTKSENITVTWRRSARSSGGALGAPDVIAVSTEDALPVASATQSSDGFQQLHTGALPKRRQAPSGLSCLRPGIPLVYVILAECRLILPEAQAPQPDHNVHDGRLQSGVTHIICRGSEGV